MSYHTVPHWSSQVVFAISTAVRDWDVIVIELIPFRYYPEVGAFYPSNQLELDTR